MAWTGGVVRVSGANGQPTWAFRAANTANSGNIWLTFDGTQRLLLKSGPRYRISFSGKTSTAGAGTAFPNIALNVWHKSFRHIASWYRDLADGVPIGNGWHRFSREFTVPADVEGEVEIGAEFFRSAVFTEHFVDDFIIEFV